MEDWWSEETKNQFAARQKCFVDEYDGYGFASFDGVPDYEGRTTVDGARTLGENIADNGGLREAHRAYRVVQLNFTQEIEAFYMVFDR